MAKTVNILTDKQIAKAPKGLHQDGAGLAFRVRSEPGKGSWTFRYSMQGQKEIGLGRYPMVSLAQARQRANELRDMISRGTDPKAPTAQTAQTVAAVIDHYFDTVRSAELKRNGKAGRWRSPLDLYAVPALGKRPIADVTRPELRALLTPVWTDKRPTADKLANRLSQVWEHAAYTLEIPGVDGGLVKSIKPPKRTHVVTHHAAMPWEDVPEFYASLTDRTTAERGLKLAILTGVRTSPIRFCHTSQIDGDCWTIPADNEKTGRDFHVPLPRVVRDHIAVCIDAMPGDSGTGYLFTGHRGKPASDMFMSTWMKRHGHAGTPHGFRSSIREWAAAQGGVTLAEIECLTPD